MKKQILNTLAVVALMAGVVSCKEEDKNKTEVGEAQEVSVVADAQKFMVDADASTIMWEGSKPTGKHMGTINIDNGVVNVAGDVVTGTFLIDMTSIEVTDLKAGEGKEDLEGHLKGTAKEKEDHFFNVAKYPTAAFEVTGVTEKDGKKMMQGNLTIRDQKKSIEFPVNYSVNGNQMTLMSETFMIDRTEWGVNYGSQSVFDNLGDKFISDDVALTVNIKATKA
ncbi:YceI family protein [Dokdonia sp. Hel_I_53]|uniref:YceI family protein n=1 Tax=Dokdonia sp. Hel_I_53 TaxID=1566287 RepID=UPI001199CC20|nr:YceI family protein [Dokdonia sp. Hel_I_53]TVZ53377.1 polyisoprenoid-binding protein YceI [Dokdonia sp. Hel_I_53]